MKFFLFLIMVIITVSNSSNIYIDPYFYINPNLINNTFGTLGQFFTKIQTYYPSENIFSILIPQKIEEKENFNVILQQNITISSINQTEYQEINIFSQISFEIYGEFSISNIIFEGKSLNNYLNFKLLENGTFLMKVNFNLI